MDISGMGRIFDQARTMQFEIKGLKQNEDTQKAHTLQLITNKLKSGKRLSHAEMEYLKVHAPALYEKALKIEKEREEYRRALRNCKSKEEVRRVQASKNMQLQAEAGIASKEKNNDEKLEFIGMRIMAMLDEFAEFVKSKEYMELPDEDKPSFKQGARAKIA